MVLRTADINSNKIIFIQMNVLFFLRGGFLITLLIQQHLFKQRWVHVKRTGHEILNRGKTLKGITDMNGLQRKRQKSYIPCETSVRKAFNSKANFTDNDNRNKQNILAFSLVSLGLSAAFSDQSQHIWARKFFKELTLLIYGYFVWTTMTEKLWPRVSRKVKST